MSTIQEELDLAFLEVGTQFNNIRGIIGSLANLTTTQKSSLVDAINELRQGQAQAGAQINDTTPGNATVFSSAMTVIQIIAAKDDLRNELLGGAGPTIDTLKEIADLLIASDLNDDNALAGLTTALGNRLRVDAPQTLDAAQKAQGNTNLGSVSLAQFGDPAHSYRNVLLAAMGPQ
jgi:hypothetical protein